MAIATGTWQRYDPARPRETERAALRAVSRELGWSPSPPPRSALAALRAALPAVRAAVSPAPRPAPARPPVTVTFRRPAAEPARPAPSPAPAAAATGQVPDRPLRLAEYLFHLGKITWAQVSEALRWQRAQRPLVGQIAIQRGHLTHDDVRAILELRRAQRAFETPFCEFAAREGFLAPAHATAIVGQQRRLQRRIGDYFVAQGILEEPEVDALAEQCRVHNARARWQAALRAGTARAGKAR